MPTALGKGWARPVRGQSGLEGGTGSMWEPLKELLPYFSGSMLDVRGFCERLSVDLESSDESLMLNNVLRC